LYRKGITGDTSATSCSPNLGSSAGGVSPKGEAEGNKTGLRLGASAVGDADASWAETSGVVD
jgi:hypothetical protein